MQSINTSGSGFVYRILEAIQAANIAAVGIGASVKPAVPDVFLDNTEELSIEKIENLLYK